MAVGTSPKVIVPIIKTYGKVKGFSSGKVSKLVDKMKSGKKLTPTEKKFVTEAIENKVTKKELLKAGASSTVLANQAVNNEE